MTDNDYHNNNSDNIDDGNNRSFYTDEEYEKFGYRKPEYISHNEIDLELSETLEKEGIIQKFVKDLKDNSVKVVLNSIYKPNVVSVFQLI